MGLPSISIEFSSKGTSAIQRSERGVVAVILKATKKQYLQMADTLNSIYCPVLCFEDRAITLQDVQVQPTDDVLHYKFTLKFEVQQGEAPELENMGELLLNEEV